MNRWTVPAFLAIAISMVCNTVSADARESDDAEPYAQQQIDTNTGFVEDRDPPPNFDSSGDIFCSNANPSPGWNSTALAPNHLDARPIGRQSNSCGFTTTQDLRNRSRLMLPATSTSAVDINVLHQFSITDWTYQRARDQNKLGAPVKPFFDAEDPQGYTEFVGHGPIAAGKNEMMQLNQHPDGKTNIWAGTPFDKYPKRPLQ